MNDTPGKPYSVQVLDETFVNWIGTICEPAAALPGPSATLRALN